MTVLKKAIFSLIILSICCVLTGCNTVHGAGQDIENAGQGIKDASR
jgi:predicted small secreted protein